jgi:predicted amidohydrolase
MNKINVTIAQISCKIGNVEYNLKKCTDVIRSLDNVDKNVICFPELALTGYMIKDLAFELSKDCENALNKISNELNLNQIVIIGTILKSSLDLIHNSVEQVKNTWLCKKFYLPTYGLFEEMRYFTPGDPRKDLKIFEAFNTNFGVVICEDAWHTEPIEALSRLGAKIIFCASSSPLRGLTEEKAIHCPLKNSGFLCSGLMQ